MALPEVLLAAFFLTMVFFGFFQVNQSATVLSQDALYELHAIQLAQETINICVALGFDVLKHCCSSSPPAIFPYSPVNSFVPVADSPIAQTMYYPPESKLFLRKVTLTMTQSTDERKGIRVSAINVTVTIRPRKAGIFTRLLSRQDITVSRLIFNLKP